MRFTRKPSYFTILLILTCTFIIYLGRPTTLFNLFHGEFDPKLSVDRELAVYKRIAEALRNIDKSCEDQGFYCKRPETQHVDCGRILGGDKVYLQSLTGSNRIPLIENPFLNLTCSAIKSRIIPKTAHFKPLKLNGTAFARIVFADYEFIEQQVQASYHPQNVFCFAVDANSSTEFQGKIKKLEQCLPNVVMLPVTESYDSKGHNINLAHYNCMKKLETLRGWGYLMLLQNHDVITKSVYELDRIFELLGGANDVFMSKEMPGRRKKHLKWDLKSLKLFRNESKNSDFELEISSGTVHSTLSRAAVKWLVGEIDLSIFIDQWNQTDYGADEQFISTFQMSPDLKMPGHFTNECIHNDTEVVTISRLARWVPIYLDRTAHCTTRTVRHDICIFGIEDFRAISKFPILNVNKMLPAFDYSIIECTAELLHNRTYLGQVDQKLEEDLYKNLVSVQYHKNHKKSDYKLNCTSDFPPWNYSNYL